METEKIRKQMMQLWKDTFHDSDKYIELIFNRYFSLDWIEYYSIGDHIVSALMGIPYKFKYGKYYLNTIYLCGLATREEYRNQGIMNTLITKINKKAELDGFSFSFLIPASESLRIFYHNKGYFNGMYRIEERFTEIHNFDKEATSDLNRENDNVRELKSEYYQNLIIKKLSPNDKEIRNNIIEYIKENESLSKNYSVMIHETEDLESIITENEISGGNIYYGLDSKEKVRGCAFVTFGNKTRIIVPKIFFDDNYVYYKILDVIKKEYIELPMSVFRFPEEVQRKVLWGINYIIENNQNNSEVQFGTTDGVYDISTHSLPYGMVKILNLNEILKFISETRRDLKFSILIKDKNLDFYEVSVNDGNFKIEPIDNPKERGNELILTEDEFYSLLLRKKDNSALITETLNIPRLSLNMALLLD